MKKQIPAQNDTQSNQSTCNYNCLGKGKAERTGGKNIKYTAYNITMKAGRVEYVYTKLHRIYEQCRHLCSLHTHSTAMLPISFYFQPYLVFEFSFNSKAWGSTKLQSWLVNVSFKGRSKIKPIFKSPPFSMPSEITSQEQWQCVWMRACVCRGGCCFLLSLASDSCLQGLA